MLEFVRSYVVGERRPHHTAVQEQLRVVRVDAPGVGPEAVEVHLEAEKKKLFVVYFLRGDDVSIPGSGSL